MLLKDFSLCLVLLLASFADASPDNRCLECICQASSGCKQNIRCHNAGNSQYFCGPYQISWAYWADAGKPGYSGFSNDFENCLVNKNCAEAAVRGYMAKWASDCNGDGKVDCLDYAAIHKAGPTGCNQQWLLNSKYWNQFNQCYSSPVSRATSASAAVATYASSHHSSASSSSSSLSSSASNTIIEIPKPILSRPSFGRISTAFPTTPIITSTATFSYQDTTVPQDCMECLCQASSKCDVNRGCDGAYCGPYLLSWGYWADGGQPQNDYVSCAKDKSCSELAIQGYMNKWKKDCNGDGRIDCTDFALIHKLGPHGCAKLQALESTDYWNNYQKCHREPPTPINTLARKPETSPIDETDFYEPERVPLKPINLDVETRPLPPPPPPSPPQPARILNGNRVEINLKPADIRPLPNELESGNGGVRITFNNQDLVNTFPSRSGSFPPPLPPVQPIIPNSNPRVNSINNSPSRHASSNSIPPRRTLNPLRPVAIESYNPPAATSTLTEIPQPNPRLNSVINSPLRPSTRTGNRFGSSEAYRPPEITSSTPRSDFSDRSDIDDIFSNTRPVDQPSVETSNIFSAPLTSNDDSLPVESSVVRISNTNQQPPNRNANIYRPRASNNSLVPQECLECICHASSRCSNTIGCVNDGTGKFTCGPYQVDWEYWTEAGKPGNRADLSNLENFQMCLNNRECADETVHGYMAKYRKDCNDDGVIDCNDYASIHIGGPNNCNAQWYLDSKYYSDFRECYDF